MTHTFTTETRTAGFDKGNREANAAAAGYFADRPFRLIESQGHEVVERTYGGQDLTRYVETRWTFELVQP